MKNQLRERLRDRGLFDLHREAVERSAFLSCNYEHMMIDYDMYSCAFRWTYYK